MGFAATPFHWLARTALAPILCLALGPTTLGEVVLVAGSSSIGYVDLTSGQTGLFAELPQGEGHNPRGIVVAPDGSVFIGNLNGNESVFRISPGDGTFDFQEFAGPYPRFGPGHLAIDPSGHLLVAGDDQDLVYRYELPSGRLIDSFASGTGNVLGLALDGNTLYISEIFQDTIQRFDLSTVPARGTDFINDSRLSRIFGITVGHNNNLLVSDTEQPFIFEYSLATGQWLRNFIDLSEVGLGSAQDIKYSQESNSYLIPSQSELLQFTTSGDLIARHILAGVSGAKAVTPAGNAPLPPLSFKLESAGLASDAVAQTHVGTLSVTGPPVGSALSYKFDNTEAVGLLPLGSDWSYFDLGREPHPEWSRPSYDDASWNLGEAPLGYGDPFIVTEIDYGPSGSNKYRTSYFRHEFAYEQSPRARAVQVRLHRDDGAVVYLNGQELFRSNMDDGPVSYDSFSSNGSDGFDFFEFPASMLRSGINYLAVEVHQASTNSSDLAFDLALDLVLEQTYHNDLFAVSDDALTLVQNLTPEAIDGAGALTTKLRATDFLGRSLSTTFTIPLVNSPPALSEFSVGASRGTSTSLAVAKILRHVVDNDGDAIEILSADRTTSQGGVVTLAGDSLTYTPAPNYAGPDQIRLMISDGTHTVAAMISIEVEDPGRASDRNPATLSFHADGTLRVAFHGVPAFTYGVERSIDMVSWMQIAAFTADAEGRIVITDPEPPEPTALYRLVYPAMSTP